MLFCRPRPYHTPRGRKIGEQQRKEGCCHLRCLRRENVYVRVAQPQIPRLCHDEESNPRRNGSDVFLPWVCGEKNQTGERVDAR